MEYRDIMPTEKQRKRYPHCAWRIPSSAYISAMTSVALAAFVVVARCSCNVAALQSIKIPTKTKTHNHTFHIILRTFQSSDCVAEITPKVFARSMQVFLCCVDAVVTVFLGVVQILLCFLNRSCCIRTGLFEFARKICYEILEAVFCSIHVCLQSNKLSCRCIPCAGELAIDCISLLMPTRFCDLEIIDGLLTTNLECRF